MSAEAIAGFAVFLATGVLAGVTYRMADAAMKQVNDRRAELEEAARPVLFTADVWIPNEPGLNKNGRLFFRVTSKGLANLGSHALAIHHLTVLDEQGNALARSNPMTVIAPSQSIGGPREVLFEPMYALPDRPLAIKEFQQRARILEVRFRGGAALKRRWAIRLTRSEVKGRWMNFSGRQSKVLELGGKEGRK